MKLLKTYLLFFLCSVAQLNAFTPTEARVLRQGWKKAGALGAVAGGLLGYGFISQPRDYRYMGESERAEEELKYYTKLAGATALCGIICARVGYLSARGRLLSVQIAGLRETLSDKQSSLEIAKTKNIDAVRKDVYATSTTPLVDGFNQFKKDAEDIEGQIASIQEVASQRQYEQVLCRSMKQVFAEAKSAITQNKEFLFELRNHPLFYKQKAVVDAAKAAEAAEEQASAARSAANAQWVRVIQNHRRH